METCVVFIAVLEKHTVYSELSIKLNYNDKNRLNPQKEGQWT